MKPRSCVPKAVPVTIRNRAGPSRVTVKSHSMPPRALSMDVYTTEPTGLSTSLPQSRWRRTSAPGPTTSSFEKDVSSKSPARSRVARCSASIAGDQIRPANPRGRRPSSPAAAFGSNQFGRSQPDFSPNEAPSSRSLGYAGDRRSRRPSSRSWFG